MITEFQDGFITKTKLNELVGGINANSGELVEIKTKSDNIIVLTGDITKTVGSGGDFATLNLAVDWCKKVIPNGHKVELNILAGFIMQEQLVINNLDLSFLEITSIDSTVSVNRESLINLSYLGYYFAFEITNMSKSPIISTIFSMNESGSPSLKCLTLVDNMSEMLISDNSGFINSAINSYVSNSSKLTCGISDFGGSTGYGIIVSNNSIANLKNATFTPNTSSIKDVKVINGGIATCSSLAILSQTANTITANGIIFQ